MKRGRYVGTRRFRVRGQRTPEVNKVALIALKYFNALIAAKLIASINALTLTALKVCNTAKLAIPRTPWFTTAHKGLRFNHHTHINKSFFNNMPGLLLPPPPFLAITTSVLLSHWLIGYYVNSCSLLISSTFVNNPGHQSHLKLSQAPNGGCCWGNQWLSPVGWRGGRKLAPQASNRWSVWLLMSLNGSILTPKWTCIIAHEPSINKTSLKEGKFIFFNWWLEKIWIKKTDLCKLSVWPFNVE